MKLATVRHGQSTRAVRVDGDGFAHILPYSDVGALLADPQWSTFSGYQSSDELIPSGGLDFAPLVTPQKFICVGLNYRSHILEMGRELPTSPTLFAKFPDTVLGTGDDLVLPSNSDSVDWEAELGVVIGSTVRHADEKEAAAAIAGYTIVNDISMRDWQWQTTQWTAGKNFEASTPVGPLLLTTDEIDSQLDLEITCTVDGEVMQYAHTSDLLFSPAQIVSYVSQFTALHPGDLIATGTPGGVAAGRGEDFYLRAGQVVTVAIEGIGSCTTKCVEGA